MNPHVIYESLNQIILCSHFHFQFLIETKLTQPVLSMPSSSAGQPGQVGTPISGAPAGTPGSGGTAPRRMNANKTGSKDLVGPKSGNLDENTLTISLRGRTIAKTIIMLLAHSVCVCVFVHYARLARFINSPSRKNPRVICQTSYRTQCCARLTRDFF